MAGEKSELPEEKFKNSIFLKILKHGPGLFSVGMLLLLFKLIPQLWIHLFFEIVPLLTWIGIGFYIFYLVIIAQVNKATKADISTNTEKLTSNISKSVFSSQKIFPSVIIYLLSSIVLLGMFPRKWLDWIISTAPIFASLATVLFIAYLIAKHRYIGSLPLASASVENQSAQQRRWRVFFVDYSLFFLAVLSIQSIRAAAFYNLSSGLMSILLFAPFYALFYFLVFHVCIRKAKSPKFYLISSAIILTVGAILNIAYGLKTSVDVDSVHGPLFTQGHITMLGIIVFLTDCPSLNILFSFLLWKRSRNTART